MMGSRTRQAAVATILFAMAPSLAQAAPSIGVVAVGDGDVSEFRAAAPAATVDLWSQALANLAIGGTSEHHATALAQLRRDIAAGWRSYLQLDADAASRLASARDSAIAMASDVDGRATLAEASLRLGVVTASTGATSARDALRLALTLSPNRSLDEREFSPDVLALIAAIRGEARTLLDVTLDVSVTTLSAATVEVGGVSAHRGDGAQWTASLEEGDHLVAIATSVAAPRLTLIHVEAAKRTFALTAPTAQLTPSLREGDDVESARRVLADGMTVAAVDDVVVVARDHGNHEWLAQWCLHTRPLMCSSIVEAHDAEAAWRALVNSPRTSAPTLASDARLQASMIALLPINEPTHRLRWVGAGAAIVAVVVGAIAWSLTTQSGVSPTILIDGTRFTR